MRFNVVWLPAAEDELAKIFLRTKNQSALAGAANYFDRVLAGGPFDQGESRFADVRIAFERPLGIHCRVLPEDLLVQVGHLGNTSPGNAKRNQFDL